MTTHGNATAARRNLGAEIRWVEEGHRIHHDPEAHAFYTRSDTSGRRYDLEAHAVLMGDGSWPVAFGCNCPNGVQGSPPAIGTTGCKHRAGLARRLEREGLIALVDGRWEATAHAIHVLTHPGDDEPEPVCAECGGALVDHQPVKASRYREATGRLCGRCIFVA